MMEQITVLKKGLYMFIIRESTLFTILWVKVGSDDGSGAHTLYRSWQAVLTTRFAALLSRPTLYPQAPSNVTWLQQTGCARPLVVVAARLSLRYNDCRSSAPQPHPVSTRLPNTCSVRRHVFSRRQLIIRRSDLKYPKISLTKLPRDIFVINWERREDEGRS